MDPIVVGSELLILIIKMWMQYQKSEGLTDEQINESFAKTFSTFMVVSSIPVDPVKE